MPQELQHNLFFMYYILKIFSISLNINIDIVIIDIIEFL